MSAHPSDTRGRHSYLAIGIFVALFFLALIAGYVVYNNLVDDEEQKTREALNTVATVRGAAVSTWMRERLADAKVFSSGRFLGEAMDTWISTGGTNERTRQQILEQLKAIKSTYDYLDVCIYDINGHERISTEQESSNSPLLLEKKSIVMHAFASNAMQVSSIHPTRGEADAKRVVHIATPLLSVYEGPRKIPSVLLLTANADKLLEAFIQPAQTTAGGMESFLAEIRGEQVVALANNASSPYFVDLNVLSVSPSDFFAALKNPSGNFLLTAMTGETMMAVARKIDGVPWFLVTMIDQEAPQAALNRLAWIVATIAAGLLTLFGAAVLFWWKEREVEFRFQSLQAATEKELLQRQYTSLSKFANDLIVLTDPDGRIIEANDKATQVFDHNIDLKGAPFWSIVQASGAPELREARENLRANGTAMFEVTHHASDGNLLRVEFSARALEQQGKRLVQMIGRDVTDRWQVEAALRDSQNRLNGILTSILDVVWSLSPDRSRLHYINQSVEQIYGHPSPAFLENPQLLFDQIHPEDKQPVEDGFSALDAQHPVFDKEYRIVRPDHEIRWLHCKGLLVLDERGKPVRIDGVTTDITARKDAEQQVQQLAHYDSVTLLPNRRLLNDRLRQAINMATRSEKKVALLYMDLDNFKNVNDSLGHHIGDLLLREIAARLMQCVREEDTVARIGGDEFLVVLPDIKKATQAVAVAKKILATTALPFQLEEHQIYTTISIGISICPDDASEPSRLIQNADSALYQAKGQGRNNYQFFTQELNRQITRSSNIERQLREAVDAGELSLWYQPQIDIEAGKLIGAEALLRWRGKEGEILSPMEFIPIAEERGLIERIGEWVLREACTQCRHWQKQGFPVVPIAVNVSPIQFQQKGFANLVTGILADTGLAANYLELEITESSIMRRAPQVAQLAMQLRKAGVGISIDDFGTGYSSLSYLKQIPIDKIKIDQSFIKDMLNDDDDDAITYAIVNLAHSLSLKVIAEGVEGKAQIDRLRLYGCDEVQGHYYSPAVCAQDFEHFLTNGKMFADAAELRQ
ncbi:MAG TPA: EAL domain-containing protein [Noviherbaspirillum sp.]|nr:EAL domain-containing protein [Noviherbaspirillum sp.]